MPALTRRYKFDTTSSSIQTDFITPGQDNVGRVDDLLGDVDNYYDVNGFDFLLWQRGVKKLSTFTLPEQLAHWEAEFGLPNHPLPSLASVETIPEPFSLLMAELACGIAVILGRSAARH